MKLTEDQLTEWGRRIGAEVAPPVFIGLKGPLGAGKSVFARAVARGAGVEAVLPSPTFNFFFRYPVPGRFPVIHADLFRIGSVPELAEIGWDEILAETAIVLTEWPCRAEGELPPDRWEVDLRIPDDAPERRTAGVERFGDPGHLPRYPVVLG